MKTVSLSGSLRENVGKRDATLLRRANRVPAVLYGGKEQKHFSVSVTDMNKLYYTPNVYIIELEIEGVKTKAIIQEMQINPVTDVIRHVDFLEVSEDKPVKIKIPLTLTGFSVGVRNGGKLRQNFRRVTTVSLLKDLPDSVEVDITDLKIGDKVRISDLNKEGVSFIDAKSAVVVGVQTSRGAILDEEEEGAEEVAEGTEEATAE